MMTELRHPARTMAFDELITGLDQAFAAGNVYKRTDRASGLSQFTYSSRCVYDNAWDAFSLMARGLVLDEAARRVVATPFPKFFNAGERGEAFPDLPFEVFEKLDGSLIIIFHHGGGWRCATKGAFDSEQAQWAQARLDAADLAALTPGTTYLAEAVYPQNRIVVRYDEPALVLLAAYEETGMEMSVADLAATGDALGWRLAKSHAFDSIDEMLARAQGLPSSEEGYVVRFTDGRRLKIKGAEYSRIHALISHCTPLAMWDALFAGDDMADIRRRLPEEYWGDFDAIMAALTGAITSIETRLATLAASIAHLSDKEVGLALMSYDADLRRLIFPYRRDGGINARTREILLRLVRPTGNALKGYTPSYKIRQALDDA